MGVGDYFLSSKVYVLPVPNLRVDCTIRFHVRIGDTEVELWSVNCLHDVPSEQDSEKQPFYGLKHFAT